MSANDEFDKKELLLAVGVHEQVGVAGYTRISRTKRQVLDSSLGWGTIKGYPSLPLGSLCVQGSPCEIRPHWTVFVFERDSSHPKMAMASYQQENPQMKLLCKLTSELKPTLPFSPFLSLLADGFRPRARVLLCFRATCRSEAPRYRVESPQSLRCPENLQHLVVPQTIH